MTERAQDLLQKALSLTEHERAQLAGSLMKSLEPEADVDAETEWQSEIAKRVAALDSGDVRTVPWREVRRELKARPRNEQERD